MLLKRSMNSQRNSSLMPFPLHPTERKVAVMYEQFFEMKNTPFTRNVPPEKLYESSAIDETLGRLSYAADRQLFAVVTADAGCGKSTLIRKFVSTLPKDEYIFLYMHTAKLDVEELLNEPYEATLYALDDSYKLIFWHCHDEFYLCIVFCKGKIPKRGCGQNLGPSRPLTLILRLYIHDTHLRVHAL